MKHAGLKTGLYNAGSKIGKEIGKELRLIVVDFTLGTICSKQINCQDKQRNNYTCYCMLLLSTIMSHFLHTTNEIMHLLFIVRNTVASYMVILSHEIYTCCTLAIQKAAGHSIYSFHFKRLLSKEF